jgi:hypothetical protein
MPSGWDVYYLIFLSAAMALLIPLGLGGISLLFFPSGGSRKRRLPSADLEAAQNPQGTDTVGNRVNVRFFLGVNSALVLIALVLATIPTAVAIRASANREELLRNLFALVSIAGLASLGLLYSVVKGDLSWLKSYQAPPSEPPTKKESGA